MFTTITHDRSHHTTAIFSAMLNILLFAAVLLTFTPASAQELQVEVQVDAGDDDSAAPTQILLGGEDVPAPIAGFVTQADDKVVVEETATDLFAAGREVTLRGVVLDNAFVAGESVYLDGGRVEGDLFIAAGTARLDGEVLGDVYGFGGDVRIGPDTIIHGDIRLGCGDLHHEGTVKGIMDVGAGMAHLDGEVGGDVKLEVGELHVGPDAVIGGDLTYQAPQAAEIGDSTTVGGTVDFTQVEPEDHAKDHKDGSVLGFLVWHTFWYLGALIVGCVLLRITGRRFGQFADALIGQPGRSVGIGFVVLVTVPAFAIVGLVAGLQLGLLTGMVYLIALYVAGLIASLSIGTWLLRRLGREDASPYAAMALGLLALHLVLPVPYLGFVVRLVVVVAGLGAMWVAARNGRDEQPAV